MQAGFFRVELQGSTELADRGVKICFLKVRSAKILPKRTIFRAKFDGTLKFFNGCVALAVL
jgi:hypothetical protein